MSCFNKVGQDGSGVNGRPWSEDKITAEVSQYWRYALCFYLHPAHIQAYYKLLSFDDENGYIILYIESVYAIPVFARERCNPILSFNLLWQDYLVGRSPLYQFLLYFAFPSLSLPTFYVFVFF